MPATKAQHANDFRAVEADDLPALKAVIDAIGMFPGDLLDDMLAGYLAGTAADELWLTNTAGEPCLIGYCAPERMTDGTWNVLLMAVCPTVQGSGFGGLLLRAIEAELITRQARVVLVETSGVDAFARARQFYRECGYHEEATIREFWAAGDDKIVFRKALSAAANSRVAADPPT